MKKLLVQDALLPYNGNRNILFGCDFLKILYPFAVILTFSFVGELLNHLLPLPVPASVYGLLLLFLSLKLNIVKLEKIESLGNAMISLLPILFVPPVVNLLACWDVVRDNLLAIVGIVLLSTILVFGISGKISQIILDRKGEN